MTDKEIIKALECCLDAECYKCPLLKDSECRTNSVSAIIDLINRQQAEISVKNKLLDIAEEKFKTIRAEAIKEFAERLCEGRVSNDPVVIAVRCAEKEMTGETKPPADVVEVVRCKDCKHKKEDILTDDIMWCRRFAESVRPDGFCSFGKREEEE